MKRDTRETSDAWSLLFLVVVAGIGCAGILECWLMPERGVVDGLLDEPRGACHGCP